MQLFIILFMIVPFALGIAADVIVVPIAVVIGIPGFIIYHLYNVYETR